MSADQLSYNFRMAYACSKEEDMTSGCCCSTDVNDVKPRPFDPHDTYQKFEIANYKTGGSFSAKSVVHGAFPPYFLRRKGWRIDTRTPRNYTLGEALGVDTNLRARLPDLNFSLSHKSSKDVAIGKWYCPFMFIKDGTLTSRNQMTNSMFYEVTLEQRWEQIFERENINHENVVMVDAFVQREVVLVGGREAVWDEKSVVDNTIWEEERIGWVAGDERVTKVSRVEEFGGGAEWMKCGCYVLVERFVLKRMDRSSVMTYDFKHTHQAKCLWE